MFHLMRMPSLFAFVLKSTVREKAVHVLFGRGCDKIDIVSVSPLKIIGFYFSVAISLHTFIPC